MNLWVKNSGLLLVVALFLFSCDDPNDIGGSVNPNGNDVGVFYAELPVSASIVLIDSINSKNSGSFLVGRHHDPDFGKVSASVYSRVLPSVSNPKVPEDIIVDSVLLYVRKMRDNHYGDDFTAPQIINVHALTGDINYLTPDEKAQQYYTFNKTDYETAPLGSISFTPDPLAKDTLVIPLQMDDIVLNQWLQSAKAYTLDSTGIANFFNSIKGVALVPDENNSVVFGFDSRDAQSRISVFYHTSTTESKDSINFRFYIPDNNGANFATNYQGIEADRAGTPLEGIIPYTEFSPNNNTVYLQSGTGIVPKIDIENLDYFLDTIGNVIINHIELVTGEVDPFSAYKGPPHSISYYFTDETNKYVVRSEAIRIPNNQNQSLVSEINNEKYRGEITNYIDLYIRNRMDIKQFFLFPEGINSTLKQAKIPTNNLKLKIYYTKLN